VANPPVDEQIELSTSCFHMIYAIAKLNILVIRHFLGSGLSGLGRTIIEFAVFLDFKII
jgi:hypothetical protein